MECEQNNPSNKKMYDLYDTTKIFEILYISDLVKIVKKVSMQFFNKIYSLSETNKKNYLINSVSSITINKNKCNKKVHFNDECTYYSEKIIDEQHNALNEITHHPMLIISHDDDDDDEWGWFIDLDY